MLKKHSLWWLRKGLSQNYFNYKVWNLVLLYIPVISLTYNLYKVGQQLMDGIRKLHPGAQTLHHQQHLLLAELF